MWKQDERARVRISAKATSRFKTEIRRLTSRVRSVSSEVMLGELDVYLRGWAGYYARFEGCRNQLSDLDGWIRRRLRQWLWVRWKTSGNRRRHMLRAGVPQRHAILASSIRSPWKASGNPSMNACVTNARIERAGLVPLLKHWKRLATL